jgi:transposase-like protein
MFLLEGAFAMVCEHCGSEVFCKNGFTKGKQRYLCKSCGRNQTEGDGRKKYLDQERYAALVMYLEGCGFRQIARILREIFCIKIHYQIVIHWIKQAGAKLSEKKRRTPTIPVLELDELYTYAQKKQIKSEYGLLLTEIGCALVHLR